MNKKAVLHTEASNGWGGQEIRILSEMEGMKARGYDVLLAATPDSVIYRKAMEAGIRSFQLRMDNRSFISGVISLYNIIKDNGIDIVNTHSSKDSWIGSIAGRLAGARVVRSRHISSRLNTGPFTKFVYGPLCDAVTTTGESIKAQLVRELGLPPDKVRSIPTGIETGGFGRVSGDKVRSEFGIGEDTPVIGTAAVLRSWKGHEYVILAMQKLREAMPGAMLMLAGDGPEGPYLREFVREHGQEDAVVFMGHRDDIADVISAFDVCVLASYASEGIPQFVLQSMASGKPVIGTNVGGIPEVVTDGVTGLIIPPKDPDSIADAAIKLLSDKDLRTRMGEAGRSVVRNKHTKEGMLDSVEALYSEVLSR